MTEYLEKIKEKYNKQEEEDPNKVLETNCTIVKPDDPKWNKTRCFTKLTEE